MSVESPAADPRAAPAAAAAAVEAAASPTDRQRVASAEDVRLEFAESWGEMGAAWGVQPSVSRVHGYILAHGGTLTEREVRQALGLSHRAASLALAECEAWGLIQRVPESRRTGRRGPSASEYTVAGDHWDWFRKIAEQRKLRESDPVLALLEATLRKADALAEQDPTDREATRLREWLTEFLRFVRLFDRAVALVARTERTELARGFNVLGRLPDESLDRLLRLMGTLPEDELASTIEAVSRVSPAVARRVLSTVARIARLGR
jgi:DNA-binding transcriptional regulator GbsR (MarR family)